MQSGRKIVSQHRPLIATVLLAVFVVAASFPAQGRVPVVATPGSESAVIPPPDPQEFGLFGGAVSLSADGQAALVGGSFNGRRAYIFVHGSGGWALETKLPTADPIPNTDSNGFGWVVALSADGTVALVAAPTARTCPDEPFSGCGEVFIYAREGVAWTLKTILTPPRAIKFEFNFGLGLALSADGSIVLVGRPADDCVLNPCRGVVFAYERKGESWNLADTLQASNPSVGMFGAPISLSWDGNTALIGAPQTPCAAGNDCGEAYVFARSGGTWSERARLTASDARPLAFFGSSAGLAADGLTALIGAPRGRVVPESGAGSVYAFAQGGGSWSETQKITASGSADGFGFSLALSPNGQSALAGTLARDCVAGPDCGAVYRLARQGGIWASPQPLASFTNVPFNGFPVALSEDGAVGLAGVPWTSCPAGVACGVVYAFEGLLGVSEIPTLGEPGLILLTFLLAAGGWMTLRRRPRPAR